MYVPKFDYTNNIVNNLIGIESAREIINNCEIIPSYDLLLRNKAVIESSYHSTRIEGNPLVFSEVENLYNLNQNNEISKSEQEILNYFKVLKNFDNYIDNFKGFSKELILSMHYELTSGILKDSGFFRKNQEIIEDSNRNKINLISPKANKIHNLIDELIYWLNNSNELSPVLISGICHYELVKIHPFNNANAKTSRALVNYILLIKGFKKYLSLDEFYNSNKENYYNALKSNDLTKWLEYFTFGFLESIEKIKDEVIRLSKLSNKFNNKRELNEKEIIILNFIEENGSIKNKDIQGLFNISAQASYKYIKKLLNKNLIISLGNGRNTHYILNK